PSAITWPLFTFWPISTIGFWLRQFRSLGPTNFLRGDSLSSTLIRCASTMLAILSFSALTTIPLFRRTTSSSPFLHIAWPLSLAVHGRADQGSVGVVVLQKRDQARGDAHHLLGRDVDVLHLVGVDAGEVAAEAGDHAVLVDLAAVVGRVGGGQVRLRLLVGPQP